MTVKITLEFPNIDAAIVALGKLAGTVAAPVVAQPGEPRAGRSDKGRKRGAYGPRDPKAEAGGVGATAGMGGGAGPAAAPAASAAAPQSAPPAEASAPAAASAPATPPAPVAPVTRAEATASLEALVQKVNLNAGLNLLQEFGVERFRELPDEKLAEFKQKADAQVASVGK